MAEPTKQDIQAIFKRLRSIQTNKQCFDCGAKNPTWASVTYGVFLCIDCSAVHRALGVHVTFIRSTQLDVFTWLQLRAMQTGGNANAMAFFRQHGVSTSDAHQKYTSRAAGMYKEKINKSAVGAMRKYGTEVHISELSHAQSPKEKDADFFQEHTQDIALTPAATMSPVSKPQVDMSTETSSRPVPIKNGNGVKIDDPTKGPSVDAALSISPTQALAKTETRKPTIGQRKPQSAKKKGLGAKKGMGAQKVKTNFAEMENAALQREKMRDETVKQRAAQTKEEEAEQMASMRLAYQDMSVELKKQEDRIKAADPKKAQQMERLGMGFGGRSAVSHSATSDMKVIEQVSPLKEETKTIRSSNRDNFFDDFDLGSSSSNSRGSSSSNRYKDTSGAGDDDDAFFSSFGSIKTSNSSSSSSSKPSQYDSIAPLEQSRRSTPKTDYPSSSSGLSKDAQQRFAGSKSISSDQFFDKKKDMDYETRSNLDRYSASGSISSDQLFGRATTNTEVSGTDMGAIKDGMKDGVTQVAGKLSRMANGLYSSIQDKYGY